MSKLTTDAFIKKAETIHGNLYDYSKSVYITAHTKVVITCTVCHNTFEMTPSNHTHKTKPQGCPACAYKKKVERIQGLAAALHKGKQARKPLDPKDFAAPIVKDLGMRQLKNRKMRYVRLECTGCKGSFDISCDNAKRRKEHLCNTCKTDASKTVYACSTCGAAHLRSKYDVVRKPSLKHFCEACTYKDRLIRKVIRKEGWTVENIRKYLYVKEGVLYRRHGDQPIDPSNVRPRIYKHKAYYAVIVYAWFTGILTPLARRVDPSRLYYLDNLTESNVVGGFRKDLPGTLYYLKINKGEAYKIGITNRTVELRFNLTDLMKIEVLKVWHYPDGAECAAEERRILNEYKTFKYKGAPLLESGNSELFTKDVLGLDYDRNDDTR